MGDKPKQRSTESAAAQTESNALANTKISELWLHYLWREQSFDQEILRTTKSEPIRVLHPGWYNRGWGPDFREARLQIGNDEFLGDVELHIEEASWWKHGHHQDRRYNRVILHIFITHDVMPSANQLKQQLPSLKIPIEILSQFRGFPSDSRTSNLKSPPGACGLMLQKQNHSRLSQLVFQAAEQRLLSKAAPIEQQLSQTPLPAQEQLLFEMICRAVGQRNYAQAFATLAQKYPYTGINSALKAMHRESRLEILSRWIGMLDLWDKIHFEHYAPSAFKDWWQFKRLWETLAIEPLHPQVSIQGPQRPINDPIRRLMGLYYHLHKTRHEGLIKSWLRTLRGLHEPLAQKRVPQKEIMKHLFQLFPQPEWDPFGYIASSKSKESKAKAVRWIGEQRLLIILVNAILPFFLAWSQKHQDKDLKKLLFSLFLLLPAEGTNFKTSFMEERLYTTYSGTRIRRKLSYHQGLIHLYNEYCDNYYEGCESCTFPRLLCN